MHASCKLEYLTHMVQATTLNTIFSQRQNKMWGGENQLWETIRQSTVKDSMVAMQIEVDAFSIDQSL